MPRGTQNSLEAHCLACRKRPYIRVEPSVDLAARLAIKSHSDADDCPSKPFSDIRIELHGMRRLSEPHRDLALNAEPGVRRTARSIVSGPMSGPSGRVVGLESHCNAVSPQLRMQGDTRQPGFVNVAPLIARDRVKLPPRGLRGNSWLSSPDSIGEASLVQQRLESKHDGAL